MDDRAEFEQWWNDADDPPLGWERMSDGRWVPLNYELWEMWETWQAATARQRERDAQIADERAADARAHWMPSERIIGIEEVAEAIRRQP